MRMRKKIYIMIVLILVLACFTYADYKIKSSEFQLNKSFFCEHSTKKALDIIEEQRQKELIIEEEQRQKELIVEEEQIQKELTIEEEQRRKELMLQFAGQVDQNLSEMYWLYDMKDNIPFGETPLEFYADSLDDIKTLVIISSGKNSVIESETGEEVVMTCFYVKKYRVCKGKILDLISNGETHWHSWEESRESLKEIEQSLDTELIYFGTIDSYEWPKAKKPEYKLEDLESLEVYQNFYTYIEERAGFRFNADSEVYLGLWNGHSENVRMAWKWIDSSGEAGYSVARLDMNGTRSGMIDEIDKEVFEKFKGISVRMF